MSNRYLKQFQYTLEQDVCALFGSLVIGAAGAVGTVKGGGIKSITKLATAGQYEIELEDSWNRFLFSSSGFVAATPINIAAVQVLENPADLQTDFKADKKYVIQMLDFTGAAANATAGSVLSFCLHVRRSGVAPFDA
jgi:hypothetical protein